MKRVLVFLFACLASTTMFAAGEYFEVVNVPTQPFYTKLPGVLTIDGVEQFNTDLEIGAFDPDDICRGTAKGATNPRTGRVIFSLRFKAVEEGTEMHFKVYDHSSGMILDLVDALGEEIVYQGNYTYQWNGSNAGAMNPYEINFTHTSSGYTKHIEGYSADYNVDTNPNDHYYLIASPLAENITPSTITGMTEGTYDLYYFDQNGDEEQKEWINSKGVEGFAMQRGVGYLYAHGTDIDLTFTGTAYEGEGTVALSYNGDAYWAGWNLVGNPFAESAYADRAYYALQNGSELVPTEANVAVGAMEGIFVVAADENDTEMTFSTTAPNKRSSLSLNVSRANRMLDRTIVSFGGESALPKFQLRATSTKVYIPMEGKDYAIVSAEGMGEMPVNFKAEKSGSYTMNLSSENVKFSYLHLIDNLTGNDVDLLANPTYSFNAQTTDYASRFRLVFATDSSVNSDSFGFVNNSGNFCVYGIEGEATLQVYDVLGHMLSSETFSGSIEKKVNAATGVYMMRLINGNDVKVQKVIIK